MSEYKERVFADVIQTLGESVKNNAKTKADMIEGLELLQNFNTFINNYDKAIGEDRVELWAKGE